MTPRRASGGVTYGHSGTVNEEDCKCNVLNKDLMVGNRGKNQAMKGHKPKVSSFQVNINSQSQLISSNDNDPGYNILSLKQLEIDDSELPPVQIQSSHKSDIAPRAKQFTVKAQN